MSVGLKVYDQAGNIQIDITDRLTRIVGTYTATISSGKTGTITVPGISPSTHFAYSAEYNVWITTNTINMWRYSTSVSSSSTVILFII